MMHPLLRFLTLLIVTLLIVLSGSALGGSVENDRSSLAPKSADDFVEGTRYTDKVKQQMQQGGFHSFHERVKGFQDAGKVTPLKGGDGVVRQKLDISVGYIGSDGNFEFIKESDGSINHRLFKEKK